MFRINSLNTWNYKLKNYKISMINSISSQPQSMAEQKTQKAMLASDEIKFIHKISTQYNLHILKSSFYALLWTRNYDSFHGVNPYIHLNIHKYSKDYALNLTTNLVSDYWFSLAWMVSNEMFSIWCKFILNNYDLSAILLPSM